VAATAAWLRPPAPDEPSEIGPAGKRFVLDKPELARAIVRHALGRIAKGRPLALWLDDLHLAPAATAEGFAAMHHDLPQLPLLVIATARREALVAEPEKAERVEALARVFPTDRIELRPLEPAKTAEMLRATLPLSDEAVAVAVARSQGNPLFALQLVHAWAGGGHLVLDGGTYRVRDVESRGRAATTAELWDERLDVVGEPYRPAAYAAAALGADIPYDVLAQLLSTLSLDVAESIMALQRAQILLPEAGDRFRWPHALLLEHVFSRLYALPNARHVFRLAADALLFHPDAGTDRIVRHRVQNLLYAGDDPVAADVLFHYLSAAWMRVRDVAATRSALALLEGRLAGRQEGHFHRWRAEVERHAGNLTVARAEAERAVALLGALGDDEGEGHSLRLLAQIACDEGKPAGGRPFIEEAYAKFLASASDVGRADCEFVLGQIDSLLGDYESASVRLAHAARGFRIAGEPLSLAQCILVQARAEMAAGRLSPTRDMLTQARAEFLELGYALGLAQVDLALAQVAHNDDQHREALTRALTTGQRFQALGSVRGMTDSARLAAIAAFDLGDLPTASEQAREAYALATDGRVDPWGQVESSSVLAQVALAEGDLASATDYVSVAQSVVLDDAEPTQHRELTAAWLHLAAGRIDDALTSLVAARAAFSDPRRAGDHTPQLVARLLDLARGTTAEPMLAEWRATLRARMSTPPPVLHDGTRPPSLGLSSIPAGSRRLRARRSRWLRLRATNDDLPPVSTKACLGLSPIPAGSRRSRARRSRWLRLRATNDDLPPVSAKAHPRERRSGVRRRVDSSAMAGRAVDVVGALVARRRLPVAGISPFACST
jgi:tetratricopeptide (TPR) repeat protein